MISLGELGRRSLPRAISAKELQASLDGSAAFCSWDSSNETLVDLLTRWPFLFSHPLLKEDPKRPLGRRSLPSLSLC